MTLAVVCQVVIATGALFCSKPMPEREAVRLFHQMNAAHGMSVDDEPQVSRPSVYREGEPEFARAQAAARGVAVSQ
jgi:hypothetical protein